MRPRTDLAKTMIDLVNRYFRKRQLLRLRDLTDAGIHLPSGKYWLNRFLRLGIVSRPEPGVYRALRAVTLDDLDRPVDPNPQTLDQKMNDAEHKAWMAAARQLAAERQALRALHQRNPGLL